MDGEIRIKNADIAKRLQLSKATVSLALSGKGGVSGKTRQLVLDCRDEMIREIEEQRRQKESAPLSDTGKSLLAVFINRHENVICDPELDLWSESLNGFRWKAAQSGYRFEMEFFNPEETREEKILEATERPEVKGVLIYATEMLKGDEAFCRKIRKPCILYDYDMSDHSISSVCIDATAALELCCEWLIEHGAEKIRYIAIDKRAYNFTSRRHAFYNCMRIRDMDAYISDVITAGSRIESVTSFMENYLQDSWHGEALIMENFQVTAGTVAAAKRLGIDIPGRLQIVGIDEVPDIMLGGFRIPMVRIYHRERITLAASMLIQEIAEQRESKTRIFNSPQLIWDGQPVTGLHLEAYGPGRLL